MDTISKIKKEYNDVCDKYISLFKSKYFPEIPLDTYWVDLDSIGGVLYINDYFFSFDNIKYAVDNNITEDSLFEWYDHTMSLSTGSAVEDTPTLKEWWENRENKNKKLEWELQTYHKKLFDFTNKDFTTTTQNPAKNGYYIVVFTDRDGIYQRAIEYEDGYWLKHTNAILHKIARTKEPIEITNK